MAQRDLSLSVLGQGHILDSAQEGAPAFQVGVAELDEGRLLAKQAAGMVGQRGLAAAGGPWKTVKTAAGALLAPCKAFRMACSSRWRPSK